MNRRDAANASIIRRVDFNDYDDLDAKAFLITPHTG
jgi:hypothetical protein